MTSGSVGYSICDVGVVSHVPAVAESCSAHRGSPTVVVNKWLPIEATSFPVLPRCLLPTAGDVGQRSEKAQQLFEPRASLAKQTDGNTRDETNSGSDDEPVFTASRSK